MSTSSSRHLSEAQLRALSHEQLLAYTLQHAQLSPLTPAKRPASDARLEQIPEKADELSVAQQSQKKKCKTFDMSRYGQRMIALRLVYAGWNFHGFAAQATSDNTVEHHLFAALLKTKLIQSRDSCSYSRSGRTDVGVSALSQVVGFRLRSNVVSPSTGEAELDYVKIINGNLPDEIRVLAWAPVADGTSRWPKTYPGDPEPIRNLWQAYDSGEKIVDESLVRRPGEEFSARFDATSRSYKYFFVRGGLDISLMRVAAQLFEGTHDFRNFCRIDENVTNFERLMYNVEVRRASDDATDFTVDLGEEDECTMYYIFVKGQAFLWHQVRCMSAVLFDVGMGRENASIVKRMLEDPRTGCGKFSNGKPQYRMASPIPLLLYDCAYPESVVAFPQDFSDIERGYEDVSKRPAFQRADESLCKSYARLASKSSILEAMLRENDNWESLRAVSTGASSKNKNFRQCRRARNFVLDLNKGRHIPYDVRPRSDSLEMKQERAAEKRKSKKR